MEIANTPDIAQARTVDAARGLAWWTESWPLFTKHPGLWIVMGLALIVLFGLFSFIPVLGGIATAVLMPVFAGGWMIAARKAQVGTLPEIGDLFAGFQDKLTPLLVVGALLVGAVLAVAVVVGMLGLGAAFGMWAGGGAQSAAGVGAAMGAGLLAMLVLLVLSFVIAMGLWYAPALVVFRGIAPVDAVKASFAAALKNVAAFVVYFVVYVVAAIVASIPFGLGWLLLVPLLMLSNYLSYQDLFEP